MLGFPVLSSAKFPSEVELITAEVHQLASVAPISQPNVGAVCPELSITHVVGSVNPSVQNGAPAVFSPVSAGLFFAEILSVVTNVLAC